MVWPVKRAGVVCVTLSNLKWQQKVIGPEFCAKPLR